MKQLDAEQSPMFSPPGCATSRLLSATPMHLLPYANAIYRMQQELNFVDKRTKVVYHSSVPLSTEKLISD